MSKFRRIMLSAAVSVFTFLPLSVTAFAQNPIMGDDSNLPLAIGLGAGALVLLVVVLVLTRKKKKR